ncbi:MAG: methyltransferase domain-containing protein [bacterium]
MCAFKEESKKELDLLNIDPSKNLAKIAESKGIKTLNDFFSYEIAQQIPQKYEVITSTNVFQHLKDIASFAQGIEFLLAENGIWVLEFPYRINSMKTNQFDQVYHEHMYYHSVTPLHMMMDKYGMKIINVTEQDIHGGSLRLIIAKKNAKLTPDETVDEFIDKEKEYTLEYYIHR